LSCDSLVGSLKIESFLLLQKKVVPSNFPTDQQEGAPTTKHNNSERTATSWTKFNLQTAIPCQGEIGWHNFLLKQQLHTLKKPNNKISLSQDLGIVFPSRARTSYCLIGWTI
jgi:hypothetical protein